MSVLTLNNIDFQILLSMSENPGLRSVSLKCFHCTGIGPSILSYIYVKFVVECTSGSRIDRCPFEKMRIHLGRNGNRDEVGVVQVKSFKISNTASSRIVLVPTVQKQF